MHRWSNSIMSSKVYSNTGGRLQVDDMPECFDLIAQPVSHGHRARERPLSGQPAADVHITVHRLLQRDHQAALSTTSSRLSTPSSYRSSTTTTACWKATIQPSSRHRQQPELRYAFRSICDSLKRLFVYAKVQGKPDEYRKLVKAAREHRENKESAQKKKELDLKPLIDKEMHLYHAYSDSQEAKTDPPEQATLNAPPPQKGLHDFDDPRMITKEILDFYKVEDYQDIFQMYLRNNEFSKHVILSSVFKLFAFMHRFAAHRRTAKGRRSTMSTSSWPTSTAKTLPFHVRRNIGRLPAEDCGRRQRATRALHVRVLACDEIGWSTPARVSPCWPSSRSSRRPSS
jgi:hypothetical protein